MGQERRFRRRTILSGVLLAIAGCVGDDTGSGEEPQGENYTGPMVGDTELASNFPLTIEDPNTDETPAEIHWHGDGRGDWHFQPLIVPLNGNRSFTVSIQDTDYEPVPLSATSGYGLAFVPPEDGDSRLDVTIDGNQLTVSGREEGPAQLRLSVSGPDGGEWVTPPLSVQVDADA